MSSHFLRPLLMRRRFLRPFGARQSTLRGLPFVTTETFLTRPYI